MQFAYCKVANRILFLFFRILFWSHSEGAVEGILFDAMLVKDVVLENVVLFCLVKDCDMWIALWCFGLLLHLKNIFKSGELVEDSVTEKNSATAADGKNYMTKFYNLDAIISVGYRVNSIFFTAWRILPAYFSVIFLPKKD